MHAPEMLKAHDLLGSGNDGDIVLFCLEIKDVVERYPLYPVFGLDEQRVGIVHFSRLTGLFDGFAEPVERDRFEQVVDHIMFISFECKLRIGCREDDPDLPR